MTPEELTLPAIDGMRHLITTERIVKAVVFAENYRMGRATLDESTRTAQRFVTALVMTDRLDKASEWTAVLDAVLNLEDTEGWPTS